MTTALLGLGSNVGDSEATLTAAIAEIAVLPDVQVVRHSKWYRTPAVGGPANQSDYVNGAAVIETTIAPLTLLAELQHIENGMAANAASAGPRERSTSTCCSTATT